MYHLTLTAHERKAMDWLGNRYPHGNDLFRLLWGNCEITPENADWDDACDITFAIPEYIAWQIGEMGGKCNYIWDCFAEPLAAKLTNLCEQIV